MSLAKEINVEFSCSGGPGGQNVNKTATKTVARWKIGTSRVFTLDQKKRIRAALKNRLNWRDEIVVSSSEERSQSQNKTLAIARLNQLVRKALIVRKKRKSTKPTYSSKLKRLEYKRKRSLIKKNRRIYE